MSASLRPSGHLEAVPLIWREAAAFVAAVHRHHQPPRGGKVSVGVSRGGVLVGVGIAGRPVARKSAAADPHLAEITRVATDGTPNACSFLYGALCRALKALGYRRVVTFTLPEEGGASLRAAGFRLDGITTGRSWSVPTRQRVDTHPLGVKWRWVRDL